MTDQHRSAERTAVWLHQVLAAPVAFLATTLGLVCVVSVPDVLPTVDDLAFVDGRYAGWAGVGVALGLCLAAVALLAVGAMGSGPALSIGTAGSVFGLALAHRIVDPLQLSLSLLLLCASVSCLLAGAAAMTFELPPTYRRAVIVAWTVPLAGAWPVLAWLSQHLGSPSPAEGLRLVQHPTPWLLAPVSVLIVFWGALTMLLEPDRAHARGGAGWESAWSGLLAISLGGALAMMVLGFDPTLPAGWLRPLILLATAAVVMSLAGLTMMVPAGPGGSARLGYVCLAVPVLTFPAAVQIVVMVADGGSSRVGLWLAVVLGLAAVAAAVLGGLRPSWAPVALLVVAAGCAGCWVLPDSPWLMAAGALPLCLGAGAVLGAGVAYAAETAVGWRFGAMTVVAMLALGTATAVALSWTLGGEVPQDTDATRAVGRVLLGLMFALAVLAAAVVHVLMPHQPRPDRSAAAEDGAAVDLQNLAGREA